MYHRAIPIHPAMPVLDCTIEKQAMIDVWRILLAGNLSIRVGGVRPTRLGLVFLSNGFAVFMCAYEEVKKCKVRYKTSFIFLATLFLTNFLRGFVLAHRPLVFCHGLPCSREKSTTERQPKIFYARNLGRPFKAATGLQNLDLVPSYLSWH